MKLKTLKDLFEPFDDSKKDMFVGILKAEAIKWVKEIREKGFIETDNKFIRCYSSDDILKHFFNITEEDLK